MNKCIICGKETKNKKYCSIKCKAKAMSKPKGICLYCGKQLERCETKYCSKECYQKHKKEKYKESLVYNHCVICGKLTLNEKYCSMKCLGKDNSRLKIATKNLKNTYEWTEEKLKFLQENYGKLSLEELEKELNNKKENIIATATRYHIKSQRKWTEEEIEFLKKNSDKNIEELSSILSRTKDSILNKYRYLNGFCDSKGYTLISPQKYIFNYVKDDLKVHCLEEVSIKGFKTDIFIYPLDIEVQGKAWHVDKRFYNEKELTEEQIKRIERDKRKKEIFEKEGIFILYLWEYDIVSNPKKCKKLIKEKLKELKLL